MRFFVALTVLGGLSLSVPTQPAMAQLGPFGWANYGDFGGWGYNPENELAQNAQFAAASRAQAQNAVVQSGIRGTLVQQAEARTQSEANQRQASKDWWLQTQQQQLAAHQARAASQPAASAAFASFESPVDSEIIKWPLLLQDPIFTRERARIEEPYLRAPRGPSAQDYRDMVSTAAQMKDLVRQQMFYRQGIPQDEAQAANTFLDQLAQEASAYAEKLEAAAGRAATPGKNSAPPPGSGK